MRDEVLAKLPIGTPIGVARAEMETNGFKCSVQENETTGIPYLYCRKSQTVDLLVERRWQIVIPFDEGKLRDVTVHTGLIGP